ncbi:MAG TPA: hypothetical protein VK539_38320 [Myxococcaceae bacterium]|nr:hypothetical protein [Myxococcaceae bacterium]
MMGYKRQKRIGAVLGVILGIGLVVLFELVPGSRQAVGAFFAQPPYILAGVLVVVLIIFLPRYRRSAQLSTEADRLLSQGHVVAALEKFEAARSLARSKVISTYNIGICRLQLWQLDAAERELTSLEERDDLQPWFRKLLYSALALVAALDGRLWQSVQRLDEAKVVPGDTHVMATLASAVIACRTGKEAEARTQLERPEVKKLEGPLRGLREAMLAWCQERLTGKPGPVEVISVFGEASPDKLQAGWPELVAFLLERSRRE